MDDQNCDDRNRDPAAATPRRARYRSLCAGPKLGTRRRKDFQTFGERDAARSFAPRARSLAWLSPIVSRIIRTVPPLSLRDGDWRTGMGFDPARIVCGNGSDEIIHLLASAYIGPGDEGIFTEHGFLVYKIAILAAGGVPIVAGETNLTADVDKILAIVGPRTKMVFLANPNNPTGTYLPFAEVKRLATRSAWPCSSRSRRGLCRICDPRGLFVRGGACLGQRKRRDDAHFLEDLRSCWDQAWMVLCAARRMRRDQSHSWAVQHNGGAIAAGVAALGDARHIEKAIAHNNTWLAWLAQEISELGIKVTPSAGNFLLLHFNGETQARAADRFLLCRGLILRAVGAYGLPQCLRLTVGTEEANYLVAATLKDFVASESRARA